MHIAIIPARGGSKRIPRKNLKDFCGKPIIAWSIEAAQKSGLFDHILVSTEDMEIADVARHWGAETPFMRPVELSDDYTGITEVIAHGTQWALGQGWSISAVCCVFATAPFIQSDDLIRGLGVLKSGNWAFSFPATDYPFPIFRSFKKHPSGGVEMFFPEYMKARSQDLPKALHDAGQFYWGVPSAWLNGKSIFERHSVPLIIPRWRVQDIDSQDDWMRAEHIFRQLQGGES